mmetsp:Transcript_42958/g.118824  ORF Transcript_42958/g.118824 Transcript_42958/m.118824 type:complete len:209 (-) Transcript_42958:73-699(-)
MQQTAQGGRPSCNHGMQMDPKALAEHRQGHTGRHRATAADCGAPVRSMTSPRASLSLRSGNPVSSQQADVVSPEAGLRKTALAQDHKRHSRSSGSEGRCPDDYGSRRERAKESVTRVGEVSLVGVVVGHRPAAWRARGAHRAVVHQAVGSDVKERPVEVHAAHFRLVLPDASRVAGAARGAARADPLLRRGAEEADGRERCTLLKRPG